MYVKDSMHGAYGYCSSCQMSLPMSDFIFYTPTKLTCQLKKEPFQKEITSWNNHQFSGMPSESFNMEPENDKLGIGDSFERKPSFF